MREQDKSPNSGDLLDGFEAARVKILARARSDAQFDGWTATMLGRAAGKVGVDKATASAAFPGGVGDLLRYWSETADAAMLAEMRTPEFAGKRIRDKVSLALLERIATLRPHKEAARRAAALLALPPYGLMAARLAWKTADAIWRGMDDVSTDFNFYSKRTILAGVWTSVFARWLADDSEDEAATLAFLDARIDNVMQIEKAKARARELGLDPSRPLEWLASLRYPAKTGDASRDWEQGREQEIDDALNDSFPASDPPFWTSGV